MLMVKSWRCCGQEEVSGAARSMSKAHRQETLDNYIRDANWKKTVRIGEFFSTHNGSYLNMYCFLFLSSHTPHKAQTQPRWLGFHPTCI